MFADRRVALEVIYQVNPATSAGCSTGDEHDRNFTGCIGLERDKLRWSTIEEIAPQEPGILAASYFRITSGRRQKQRSGPLLAEPTGHGSLLHLARMLGNPRFVHANALARGPVGTDQCGARP